MPSIEETKRQVKESLNNHTSTPNHDDILASLQNEIDKHNAVTDDLRQTMRHSRRRHHRKDEATSPQTEGKNQEPSLKFRFKSTHSDPRSKRKHHSHHHHSSRPRKSRRTTYPTPSDEEENAEPAHPFPREPTNPDTLPHSDLDIDNEKDPHAAFRASLFDALADDEGAQYWESVYNQPIHVFPRPYIPATTTSNASGSTGDGGGLEAMGDEEYVTYVKTKMWEKTHPEVMLERERSERVRRKAEEERTREREEFVRRRQRAAWERAERRGARRFAGEDRDGEEGYERMFAGKKFERDEEGVGAVKKEEYARAWGRYLAGWEELKQHPKNTDERAPEKLAKIIPWPTLPSQPVLKPNIEAFLRQAPTSRDRTILQLLKAERVRWHPDKIQQRFGGQVDAGTMKLVTGVFQVVDELFEEERKRGGASTNQY